MALPLRPCAAYWPYWDPIDRLVNLPTTFNLIFLFHAFPADGEPLGGSTGAVQLRKPTGTIGTNLNADIATCRARGQKIIVSVGGAGGQVYIQTQARADAFIASIKSINVGLGGSGVVKAFDGIDWNNFEGSNISGQSTWMTYVGQQLKSFYGSDFLITSPPAAFGGGQDVTDRLLLATLYKGGALDWLCPQYYDPSDLNTTSNVRYYSDFYNTAITVTGTSVQIPRNFIGIGFGIKSGNASTSRWSVATAVSCYNTMVSEGKTPRGAFNWAVYEDPTHLFATGVGPTINPDLPIGADTTVPVAGGTGTITTASVTDNTLTLNWTLGTDNVSPQNSLQYEVRRSTSNNISTVALAEANGTIIKTYTTNISTFAVTGLTASTTYYFNVIIKDQAGNKGIYTTKGQATTTPPAPVTPITIVGLGSVVGLNRIVL